MNRADVVLARCSVSKQPYGMRFEETSPSHWVVTWAFPLSVASANREGYGGGLLEGQIEVAGEFPGCPHCGNTDFALCGACQHVGCLRLASTVSTCPWCDISNPISGRITRLNTAGD